MTAEIATLEKRLQQNPGDTEAKLDIKEKRELLKDAEENIERYDSARRAARKAVRNYCRRVRPAKDLE